MAMGGMGEIKGEVGRRERWGRLADSYLLCSLPGAYPWADSVPTDPVFARFTRTRQLPAAQCGCEQLVRLLNWMLDPDPELRPSMQQVHLLAHATIPIAWLPPPPGPGPRPHRDSSTAPQPIPMVVSSPATPPPIPMFRPLTPLPRPFRCRLPASPHRHPMPNATTPSSPPPPSPPPRAPPPPRPAVGTVSYLVESASHGHLLTPERCVCPHQWFPHPSEAHFLLTRRGCCASVFN